MSRKIFSTATFPRSWRYASVGVLRHQLATELALLCRRRPSRDAILNLQIKKLRRLLDHTYRNVPYYRKLFDRNGVNPRDIRAVSDLARVPITEKNDLRRIPVRETVVRGLRPERLLVTTTSGSSGEPFAIRRTWLEKRMGTLRWIRAMHRLGMRMTDKYATIMYIRPSDPRERTFDRRLVNALGFYPLVALDCCQPPEKIVPALRKHRPDFVVGYPGALALIADHMTRQDRRAVAPRVIAAVGEVLTEEARERIGHAFGAQVYNLYGSYELGLIACECRETRELHVCDDHVLLEVLSNGRPALPGKSGELVATNLGAFAMPFIRYRLGDVVTKGLEVCSCGQPFSTLRRIEGRTIDYFPLPDGRLMHPFQLVGAVLKNAKWILRYQLTQERRDRILLHVVPSPRPDAVEIRRLEDVVNPILGPRVEFSVILVPEIEPGPGGKVQTLRSLVAGEENAVHIQRRFPAGADPVRSAGQGRRFREATSPQSAVSGILTEQRPVVTSLATLLDGLDAVQIFVHNVSSVPDSAPLTRILPGIERYPERALLLAGEKDIVCVSHPVETEFLEFIRNTLGIGPRPENVIVASPSDIGRGDGDITGRLLSHSDVLDRIAERVATVPRIILNPFIASPNEFALAEALAERLGRQVEVLGGNPDVVQRAYRKHVVRAKAIELGVPVAEGEVVHLQRAEGNGARDLTPLRAVVERRLGVTGKIIIRGTCGTSGTATRVVENDPVSVRSALHEISRARDNTTYLVDVLFDVLASPNIQMFIHPADQGIFCVGIADQLLSADLIHEGNVSPSKAERLTEMVAASTRMCEWLRDGGYTGLLGLDFVEYEDPATGERDYFLAEINPRTNGASYLMTLLQRLGRNDRSHHHRAPTAGFSINVRTTLRSFAEIRRWHERLFYKPETGCGMLPYNTGCLSHGKFTAAFLGGSMEEVEAMCEDFSARLLSRPALV